VISVIIPAFNAEETIERAIRSVLRQGPSVVEVIVSDDGSTDGTTEIVEFCARHDPRVRLLRNAHTGPGSARNAGIDVASGEWLAFLDADDEYASYTFTTILERVSDRDVGLVIFSILGVPGHVYAPVPAIARLEDRSFPGEGDRATAFMKEYVASKRLLVYSQSNKLYRRRVIDAHGLRFPTRLPFGEDRLFNYAYLRHAGTVLTMREQLLHYHYGRPGSLSSSPLPGGIPTLIELSAAKLELCRDYGYSDHDLSAFRAHEARQLLRDVVADLMRQDRTGGAAAVRAATRELRGELRRDPALLRADAQVARRERLVARAIRIAPLRTTASLVGVLRRREDRVALRTRAAAINRDWELRRLGLADASRRERARYYFLSDYEYLLDRINPERVRNLLRDKAILLRRLAADPTRDFLRREWVDLRRATVEELSSVIRRTDRIVAKPHDGTWSHGIDVIDVTGRDLDVAGLHARLIERQQYVVEGYLDQHPNLARFYPDALATLRIHTLALGDDVQLVLPTQLNVGSGGAVTNNTGSIQAFADLSTGTVISDGVYMGAAEFGTRDAVLETHPDSGVAFRGAPLAFMDDVAALVTAAARHVPEVPFIGWDVAITPGGPAIVEGNGAPSIHYGWQLTTRSLLGWRGMRSDFDAILDRFTRFERAQRSRTSRRVDAEGRVA